MEAMLYHLKIDQEFLGLIPAMQRKEYIQLELNIREDGCRDPIVVWDQTIVDGHNRYQICHKHKIPFKIVSKDFGSREEAKAWICANQLGRRNISSEYRKYLIGMQYDLERCIHRNKSGRNQYSPVQIAVNDEGEIEARSKGDHVTAQRIGEQHHIAGGTVLKYARYSRAVNKINETAPDVGSKVLDGTYKVSHEGLLEMAKMDAEKLSEFTDSLSKTKRPVISYDPSAPEMEARDTRSSRETIISTPTVKDMPQYDPDAEVAGLALTVPSWIKVIDHTKDNTKIETISEIARKRVITVLHELVEAASAFLLCFEGE